MDACFPDSTVWGFIVHFGTLFSIDLFLQLQYVHCVYMCVFHFVGGSSVSGSIYSGDVKPVGREWTELEQKALKAEPKVMAQR